MGTLFEDTLATLLWFKFESQKWCNIDAVVKCRIYRLQHLPAATAHYEAISLLYASEQTYQATVLRKRNVQFYRSGTEY